MASVFDVAAYLLEKKQSMSTMKLQKLCYYCQAWSLVWDEEELFPEDFEAWAFGPVCPGLYQAHKGKYKLNAGDIKGNSAIFNADQIETMDVVLEAYGDCNPQQLSDMTHSEDPWIDARKGLADLERGYRVIEKASMAEYYESIQADV